MSARGDEPAGLHGVLEAPAPAFSSERAAELAREIFGVAGDVEPLESERDQNFRIRPTDASPDGSRNDDPGYVLKIANQAESSAVLDLQQSALLHVASVDPTLTVPRLQRTVDGDRSREVEGTGGARHSVWLLSYLPGVRLSEVRQTTRLRRNQGRALARLARALRGYFHPAAGRELPWDLAHTSALRPHLVHIADPETRQLTQDALGRFEARAAGALPSLRAQVIHSDANSWNVVVDRADPERIAGIIDFGDIVHSALVNDLGIAIATTIVDLETPIEAACDIVAGYHEVTPLQADELDVLFELWLGRLVAEISIAAWRSTSHPDNVDYIAAGTKESSAMLGRLLALEPDTARHAFRSACGLDHGAD
jgi:Ser/Thr protein kinase RdoA (MazF antagonist)